MADVRLRAYAKLNLTLEVLNRRPDGFHNIRTIFQTVSIHDLIGVEFKRARRTRIELTSNVEIPGENLIVRAANAILQETGLTAQIHFQLQKRIPMGAGLGGGSADAAAVLRGLPPLARRAVPYQRLVEIGAELGSDVPFFLLGGAALGLGRGTELYPLPPFPPQHVLVAAPDLHVATGSAYASLRRTTDMPPFRGCSAAELAAASAARGENWRNYLTNDFEAAVFEQHPELARIKATLHKSGAEAALMTGSGAAVFGLFDDPGTLREARNRLKPCRSMRAHFVNRPYSRAIL